MKLQTWNQNPRHKISGEYSFNKHELNILVFKSLFHYAISVRVITVEQAD